MESSSETILCRCRVKGGIVPFEQSVQRWIKNPQYINRRISTAIHLFAAEVYQPISSLDLLKLVMESKVSVTMDVAEIMKSLKCNGVLLKNESAYGDHEPLQFNITFGIVIQKLLPRCTKVFREMLQIIIIDSTQKKYIFVGFPSENEAINSLSPTQPYGFKFKDDEMLLIIFGSIITADKSVLWLKDCLFPKLQHWTENLETHSSTRIQSLSLIPADQYTLLYQKLKEKYGQKLVEIWPERTDPQKFVFEDVAIAAYLLLLWEGQRVKENRPDWRQSFVDMGCGNGLLVYILSSEGHPGVGVDVRKRGIWDLYPSTTRLKVQTFVPSDCHIFPEADWIIGNHSDELTPWIPVITARSSYKCSFFLLPCCAYDFSGHKYQRRDSSRSQYSEYLEYIKTVCENCGFETDFDRLKIPSTKRICLVSSGRNYSESNFEKMLKEIMAYIKTEGQANCSKIFPGVNPSKNDPEWVWNPNFVAREPQERVRNCTQINRGIIENVIVHVVTLLLSEEHNVTISDSKCGQKSWNAGRCVGLKEIAAALPQSLLINLKKECGGLQTLLKNNHNIFCVSNGTVKLAMPVTIEEKRTSRPKRAKMSGIKGDLKLKQKPCWFFNFHPNGCPLKNEDCTFIH